MMPGVYNIPSEYSFLESLARGLLCLSEKDPFPLCQIEIFLPTRRSCIELQRVLLREGKGKCLLLPKLSPLGDLDEDEEWLTSPLDEIDLRPPISPFKRLTLLTNLIEDFTKKTALPSSPLLSLKLAKSLLRLMDQATIENVPWEGLLHLVPSEFANHWQLTLNFLEIITSHWPKIMEEKGLMEPYTRHHQMVEAILSRWAIHPPSHPIMAAGSTGTMPATARLLKAIASLPKGTVILPGLDSERSKEEINDFSPCHPQFALTRLLEKLDLHPSQVPLWQGLKDVNAKHKTRSSLFSEALKLSFTLPQNNQSHDEDSFENALQGVHFIPCASPQEEALAIAVLFRQQLETPEQRIALITSDLRLAERVRWELKRWGIEIDRSSGEALDQTPSAIFLNLCAEFASTPHDQVLLLALLKHPLFRMGHTAGALRTDIYQLEKSVLRGESFQTPKWLKEFNALTRPLRDTKKGSLQKFLELHWAMAEALSTDKEGLCQLWKGPKGETVRTFINTLKEASEDFPSLSLTEYPELLKEFFQGQVLRFTPQKHPRLAILSPMEARLFHADVMILGGLNEGTWPPNIEGDPWLNRPMRKEMGFPSPERRIGLSAHDFGQAFSSPKVYLTRALKVDGTPTLACRWLERLEVYLKAWNLTLPQDTRLLEWVRQFDQPEQQESPTPPLPRPPLHSRPRRFSVTQIETWMRDPYALYARHILKLSPLSPLNAQVEVSDRGTLIHKALEQFFKICPDPCQKHALETLLFIGKTLFEPLEEDPSVRLFWWPRFCHLAKWFIQHEKSTRLPGTKTFTEIKGVLTLETPLGLFECTAKADRIDLLPDGRLRILDYKTGSPPSDQDVQLGFSPQLPLEGAIALQQGFEGITATQLESLQFWWLKGDTQGGVIKTLSGDPHELALKARDGLERLILLYEDERMPYPARPLPAKELKYNDYAHLARLQEWGRR